MQSVTEQTKARVKQIKEKAAEDMKLLREDLTFQLKEAQKELTNHKGFDFLNNCKNCGKSKDVLIEIAEKPPCAHKASQVNLLKATTEEPTETKKAAKKKKSKSPTPPASPQIEQRRVVARKDSLQPSIKGA